ncbi:ensconsin [Amia ocellicauda]|uniref:ensconsin n=1 Tax=Amia ocellicauda TaxID=2972642 RepID=UPI003463FCAD
MEKIRSFMKRKNQVSAGYADPRETDQRKLHKSRGFFSKLRGLSKKRDVNELDNENRTPPPVQLACVCGQANAVTFLAEQKATLNLPESQHRSPLIKNDPEVTFTPVEVFVKEDSSSEEEDGGVHGAVACWDSDSDTSVFSSSKSEENVTSSWESLEKNETQLEDQVAELQAETQRLSKALVRQERLQGKLAQAKRENLLLRQRLAKAESQAQLQEEAARAAQAQLKRDRRESFEMMEELVGENTELREQISKLESKTAETEVGDHEVLSFCVTSDRQ